MQAQAEIQEGRAREAAFQAALQEVTLFKSRTSAALLQAQERAEAAQVSLIHPVFFGEIDHLFSALGQAGLRSVDDASAAGSCRAEPDAELCLELLLLCSSKDLASGPVTIAKGAGDGREDPTAASLHIDEQIEAAQDTRHRLQPTSQLEC